MSRSRNLRASSRRAAHRRSDARPQLGSILRRATLGTVVVAGAALLGLSGTAALWSSTASVAVAPVTAGSIDLTQSASTDGTVAYATGTTRKTIALTLRNTGASSANVSAAATTTGDAGLAGAVVVNVWRVSAASACTETAATAGENGSWASLRNLPTTLAAGETQYYCLRTSITDAQVSSFGGRSYAAALTLTGKRGGWTSVDGLANVSQSVVKTAPRVSCSDNNGWNVYLSWSNPAGAPTSTRYQVRSGSTVLTSNGSYWWPADWVAPSSFANSTRGVSYPVEIVRADTGEIVAAGTLRYDANGRLWCA